jgi:CBS domain-containing protein
MDRLEIKRTQVREAVLELRQAGALPSLTVGQVMTPSPTCIHLDTTVLELVRMFHTKEFRHALVIYDDGRLAGVVSDRDVLCCFEPDKAAERDVLAGIPVARLMSTDLVTIDPRATLEDAVGRMVRHGISCLPVVVGEMLVGILTNTDVHLALEAVLQTAPQESPERTDPVGASL